MSDQSTEKGKRPASQYYWGDWFKDLALQSCSLQARGLWHEMNCLMHQGEPYGHLTMPNGKPMGVVQLANLCKITPVLGKKLLAELDENGVFSKADSGAIFSRRMVRDEDIRNRRATGGQAGAEHGVKGAEAGSKGGRPVQSKGGYETPLPGFEKPPPSSSSSSSPSGIDTPPVGGEPGSTIPACPGRQLLALFKARVPELPQPRPEMWDGSAGAEAMRQRWRWLLSPSVTREDGSRYATNPTEAVEWFGRFFDKAAASDFLTGRSGAWKNCDLTWLMKRENFMKVVQGNYDNKGDV